MPSPSVPLARFACAKVEPSMKEYVRLPRLLAFMSYHSRAWLVELPAVEKIDASSESSEDPLLESLIHAEKVRF
jgi:hypothetical protein